MARFGPRAWGIQAHPEVDADVVVGWAAEDRDDLVALGLDEDAVLAEIEDAAPDLRAALATARRCASPQIAGEER